MIYGTGLSFEEDANLLEIERSIVQGYVEQVQQKVWRHINQADLFNHI